MGNIHTVGPNQAMVVSGMFNIVVIYSWYVVLLFVCSFLYVLVMYS